MGNEKVELLKCGLSCYYFIDEYYQTYDGPTSKWVDVKLWPAQVGVLDALELHKLHIILKARQLGISTICLAYALWLMIFRPAATVMFFSRRDEEAIELLSRIRKAYDRLPLWMQAKAIEVDNKHEWLLSTGSRGLAFPTTPGSARSFSATFALIDEADFVPSLDEFMAGIKPAVDAGSAKLALISTVDKTKPLSTFKNIYRAGKLGENGYHTIFLPWSVRPDRTEAWYARISQEMISQSGGTDSLWQEYPATDDQALAMRESDKRFVFTWIADVFSELSPFMGTGPAIKELSIYRPPVPGRTYVIGADTAEGNPNSDDSVATVMDAATWEEVAVLGGKVEPDTYARYLSQVATYYNNAGILVERNNHGHAVLLRLKQLDAHLLVGHDDKVGWLQSNKGKTLMTDFVAESLRDGDCVIHTPKTKQQLIDLEATTMAAPEGLHDDYAISLMLAIMGCRWVQANALVLSMEQVLVGEGSVFTVAGDMPVWSLYDSYVAGEHDEYVRCLLLSQISNGKLVVFAEHYALNDGADLQLEEALQQRDFPQFVVTSRGAADLRATLTDNQFYPRSGPPTIAQGIRNARRLMKKVKINPACSGLLRDLSGWRFKPSSEVPAARYEHGPMALINLLWALRGDLGIEDEGNDGPVG